MKKAKQSLSVLLSVFMLLLSLSVCFVSFAADASGGCGSGLTWTYSEASKTLTISGNGAMNDYTKKNYFKETSAPWFSKATEITRIIVENGVTKIGNQAFRYFKNLTKIDLPNSVETVGQYAFSECTSIVSASFGSSLKSVGAYAFNKCTSLRTINIPDKVESIADYAFYNCLIKDLALGKSVRTIGSYAFSECRLVNVTMYNKIEVIGKAAFYKQSNDTNNIISHVYYYGSENEWNNISMGTGNAPLTGAALHFMGEPSTPVTPTNPTNPTTPTNPTSPTQPTQEESPAKLSFFERILQMILDFFARLFGR